MKWGLTTTPGTICPTLCNKCLGSFTSHRIVWTVKGCETGPTVYSPYPRRLESLTICGCNYKGSTFSSVFLRPWVLVWPGPKSWPSTWQPDAQPTEPPVHGHWCRRHRTHHNRTLPHEPIVFIVFLVLLYPIVLHQLCLLHQVGAHYAKGRMQVLFNYYSMSGRVI